MARTQDALDHPVTRAVTGTALVGGVVIAVAVSLSALIAPLPVADVQEPVVIDEAPGLPSDEEPAEGWPAPVGIDDVTTDGTDATRDETATDATDDTTGTTGGDGTTTDDGLLDDVTDTVDDLVDDVTDTVDDVVDDVTDTVEDVVDDPTDTVDDVVDDATDVLP